MVHQLGAMIDPKIILSPPLPLIALDKIHWVSHNWSGAGNSIPSRNKTMPTTATVRGMAHTMHLDTDT